MGEENEANILFKRDFRSRRIFMRVYDNVSTKRQRRSSRTVNIN